MKSILVTGATTPLGHAVIARLVADPEVEEILAVGFEPIHSANGASFSAPPVGRHVHYELVDLTRPRQIHTLLYGRARELCVDTIVHTAFHRSPFKEGRRVHALNVDATREMVRLAETHPTIEHFVFRSYAEVYRLQASEPQLIDEDQALDLSVKAPQWIRDRVEADLAACTRMGMSKLRILVLRCSECLADGTGSQLFDYLRSRVCLRPIGFDPMINVISLHDLARALVLAAKRGGEGVLNIPGKDTLPLSDAIHLFGRREVPLPDHFLDTLYKLRRKVLGTEFRYDINQGRFHLGGVLDGARARSEIGYEPRVRVT